MDFAKKMLIYRLRESVLHNKLAMLILYDGYQAMIMYLSCRYLGLAVLSVAWQVQVVRGGPFYFFSHEMRD